MSGDRSHDGYDPPGEQSDIYQALQGGEGPAQGSVPYQRHSATSRAAARSYVPKAGTAQEAVLAFLRARGKDGATDQECQMWLKLPGDTQRARRVRLVELQLVRDSGRTRATPSGKQAVVWEARDWLPVDAPAIQRHEMPTSADLTQGDGTV